MCANSAWRSFVAKPDCRLCREILCGDRAGQTDHCKQYQHHTHFHNIGLVPGRNTSINDCRHNQRHDQFKGCLEQFKKADLIHFFFIIF